MLSPHAYDETFFSAFSAHQIYCENVEQEKFFFLTFFCSFMN